MRQRSTAINHTTNETVSYGYDSLMRLSTAGSALYVVDAARVGANAMPLCSIPSSGFPREIRTTADGRTLLVTNFDGGSLQIVDLERALWGPGRGRHHRLHA